MSTSVTADALFTAPIVYQGSPIPKPFDWIELGTLNPCWSAPSHVVPKSYILRLHETAGEPGEAQLKLTARAKQVELIDLYELPSADLSCDDLGIVKFSYRPWQILTIRVQLAD